MFKFFFILLKKDLTANFSDNKAWFTIAFFILCLLVFPLSFFFQSTLQLNISIPAIWISAIFANLISLDQMYKEDYNDGTLTYYFINDVPFFSVVYAKCFSHWFFSGIPIILIAPFCLYLLSGETANIKNLILALTLGTAIMTLIGSPISALMLGSSARGAMLAFITLPFYLPIIIFGVLGTNVLQNNINAEIYLLSAILCLGILIFPLLTIKILRNII